MRLRKGAPDGGRGPGRLAGLRRLQGGKPDCDPDDDFDLDKTLLRQAAGGRVKFGYSQPSTDNAVVLLELKQIEKFFSAHIG